MVIFRNNTILSISFYSKQLDSCNFWVCAWNHTMWPFRWNVFLTAFTGCYTFCFSAFLQNEIWKFCQILTFLTFGSHERVKVKVVFFTGLNTFVLCFALLFMTSFPVTRLTLPTTIKNTSATTTTLEVSRLTLKLRFLERIPLKCQKHPPKLIRDKV